jgi:hypothetical protein
MAADVCFSVLPRPRIRIWSAVIAERERERERRHGKEYTTPKKQITRDKVRLDILLLPSFNKAAVGMTWAHMR